MARRIGEEKEKLTENEENIQKVRGVQSTALNMLEQSWTATSIFDGVSSQMEERF